MEATEARQRIQCRFASRGFCRDGSNCPFAHNEPYSIVVPEHVCLYYLAGNCLFAATCRNDHVEPADFVAGVEADRAREEAAENEQPQQQQARSTPDCQSISDTDQQQHHASHQANTMGKAKDATNVSTADERPACLTSDNKLTTASCGGSHRSRTSSINSTSSKAFRSQAARLVPYVTSKCTNLTSKDQQQQEVATDKAKPHSWAQAVKAKEVQQKDQVELERLRRLPLCPFGVSAGVCPDSSCNYIHGDKCDMCYRLCLHPHNEIQRAEHHEECVREHEKQMELSFAIQRSADKACGICMDTVMEKEPPNERRFGILEKCAHIFCLSCIRKWRQTKQFDNRTIRACPECRTSSDFVVPSRYWVDDKSEKDKLIDSYKVALSKKPCKYFLQGRGECPFAGACFYLHAYPDGQKASLPAPRPRRRQNNDGDIETLRDMLLWNYLEVRDDLNHQWVAQVELDLQDIIDLHEFAILSETDDESDAYSDYGLAVDF